MLGALRSRETPLYRLRPTTTTDNYGDPLMSWKTPERTLLPGATTQPLTAEESDTLTADVARDTRKLVADRILDLTATDRVEAEGDVWLIEGMPMLRSSIAMGATTTATLRRIATL